MIKYSPSDDEIKLTFKNWYNTCVISKEELPEILSLNLKKWNKIKSYEEILKYILS